MIIALANVILVSGVAFASPRVPRWLGLTAFGGLLLAVATAVLHFLPEDLTIDAWALSGLLVVSVLADALILSVFAIQQFIMQPSEPSDSPG